VAGYDAVQYSELHPTDASKDVRVGVLVYMKALVGFLSFREEAESGSDSR
jgi:hypothetical protein